MRLRVIGWLRVNGYSFVEAPPDEFFRELKWLVGPIAGAVFAIGAAAALQVWTVVDGWALLCITHMSRKCDLLQYWLIFCCSCSTAAICCVQFLLPMMVILMSSGHMVRKLAPRECKHKDGGEKIIAFMRTFEHRGVIFMTCVLLAIICIWRAQVKLNQLCEQWGTEGPTPEDIIQRIVAESEAEVTPTTECMICLEEGALLSPWCCLKCGHQFHQVCLLEWLRRARRCPICRLDLHRAYLSS